jgi:hypothetical protein
VVHAVSREKEHAARPVAQPAVDVGRLGELRRPVPEAHHPSLAVADDRHRVDPGARAVRRPADQQGVGVVGKENESAQRRRHARRSAQIGDRVRALIERIDHLTPRNRPGTQTRQRTDNHDPVSHCSHLRGENSNPRPRHKPRPARTRPPATLPADRGGRPRLPRIGDARSPHRHRGPTKRRQEFAAEPHGPAEGGHRGRRARRHARPRLGRRRDRQPRRGRAGQERRGHRHRRVRRLHGRGGALRRRGGRPGDPPRGHRATDPPSPSGPPTSSSSPSTPRPA